jgi:carbamoyl-phosphate synthase small subunit
MNKPAILALADGSMFEGQSIGYDGTSVGELVFNTSMTGYQEMLTDPSYAKQIITLTYPHIGNVGCNMRDKESKTLWASGLVIRDYSNISSNYRSQQSLSDFLIENQCVAIAGIDTRHLTHILRDNGAQSACISTDVNVRQQAVEKAREFSGLAGCDLASSVSCSEISQWDESRGEWGGRNNALSYHVVAYDFGVKHNILRILQEKGCRITLVPATTTANVVRELNPDGVFLSNGPGDPAACQYAIDTIKELIANKLPMFGICLGFQLLCLAFGAKSVKMKFGHHGANHPVISVEDDKVFISSQNHGFAIDEASLPDELGVSHRSLFDKSLQGIVHKSMPILGLQGHPEASPGPNDLCTIFDKFIAIMKANGRNE